ncbi:sugar ABC transporter permease [Ktedonosporobacter rubrisoli]|uniref:Sugar ABC transporter permease n=2 Tax=Ktedonosporobacter rubrisoli TaxID=2509675 RepID=A0A4P6K4Z8_KTERU|nr:sugar ABC transporter permease [Ktedonosporobacter rubrisoli]
MALQAYVFLFPSLLGLVLFLLLPVFVVAGLSFFDWGLLSQPRFIGLQNYISLFQNPVVWRSLGVSVYFVLLNIPLQTLLALLLAIFMNKRLPGLGIYRTLFAVPWMATPVAMGIVWQWIFDPQFGALNNFLLLLGIHGPQWLVSQQWALPSIVIVTLWQNVGYTMLFFLAGLQSIPEHLYEAAYIDGATPFQSFFKVTLPLLNPTMFFVLVTNIIGSFQLFDTVYTMTKGGPAGSTNVLNFYIFQQAFQFFHAGYASALSMVLFAILMFVTLLLALYFHKRTTYDLS